MPIQISCSCGGVFQGPDTLKGKSLACPKCGATIHVPAQEDPVEDDLFDDLSDLEAAAYTLGPTASGPASALGGSSLAMSKSSGGIPPVAIAGGVVGLLCLVLLIVLVAGLGGKDQDRVAQRSGAEQSQTDADDSQEDDSRANPDEESANNTQDSVAEQAVQESTESNTESAQNSHGGSTPEIPGEDQAGEQESSEEETPNAPYVVSKLPLGLQQWYGGGNQLKATRRVGETDILEELHYGWMIELLPHLGRQQLYDQFDFSKPWREGKNLALSAEEIPEFLNPADDRKRYEGYRYGGMALTHFVGMSGVETGGRNVVAARLPRSDPRAGIFGYDEIAPLRKVRDGTSNTIMIIGSGELACPWIQSGGSTIRGAREPYFAELTGFGSKGGPGTGAAAVMADGSVRWIPSDIDPKVFRAMCTIGGGETVDVAAQVDEQRASHATRRPGRIFTFPQESRSSRD